MNLTQKRILADAEQRMTACTGPAMSDETAAQLARMGITNGMPEPERMRRMGEILDGHYPDTMAIGDIEWIQTTVAQLEAEA